MGVIRKLLFRMKKAVAHLTLSTTSTSATWSPQTVTNSGAVLTWDVSGNIAPTSQNVNDPTFNLSANTGTVNMDVYDVSGLVEFVCSSNQLTSLNIDANTSLQYLQCNSNLLTILDINANTSLTSLYCNSNLLTILDISTNTALTNINCSSNSISSLNLSANTSLLGLYCNSNLLTILDISTNTALASINCSSNSISSLNLSANTSLTSVQVYYNNMSSIVTDQIYIDLANGVGVNGALYIRNNRTSASDTARATLVSRGWTFNESYTT